MPPLVVPSLAPFWSSPSRSITRIPHFHEETSLPSTSARPHHKRLAEGKTKNQGGAGWAVKLSPHGELGLARGYPELLVNDHWSTSPQEMSNVDEQLSLVWSMCLTRVLLRSWSLANVWSKSRILYSWETMYESVRSHLWSSELHRAF